MWKKITEEKPQSGEKVVVAIRRNLYLGILNQNNFFEIKGYIADGIDFENIYWCNIQPLPITES